jgi:hypothetical protein
VILHFIFVFVSFDVLYSLFILFSCLVAMTKFIIKGIECADTY